MSTTFSTVVEPAAVGANDQDLSPGQEVGEYRIESVIGKGGFGKVYRAVQPLIGKHVAIKLLARKYSADPDIVSRFVAEARAVNQIRHRNIIDIFSFQQLPDGRHYYVMEYLEGEPLDGWIRNHGPMPLADALPILRAVARALDAAHAKGIAHRDLKPENIFLADDGDGGVYPKLLDFGIAKLLAPSPDDEEVRHKTETGVPIGTPYYMSPEQCRGRDVDHRTDIYSFGIVIYRLLTGTLPFEGDDYMELLWKQTQEEPPPPSSRNPALPPSVDAAVAWMMRKDRTQRPPTVLEGVGALDPSQSITPVPPSRLVRPSLAPRIKGPTTPPALRDGFSSSPDALAATFTPEFVRPQLEITAGPTVPTPKVEASPRRRWLLVGGLVAVLGVGVVAAALLLGGERARPAPAAPPPASATPPTAPSATPSATPSASSTGTPSATPGAPDGTPPPATGSAQASGSAEDIATPVSPEPKKRAKTSSGQGASPASGEPREPAEDKRPARGDIPQADDLFKKN